jgi:ATP-dependent Clp protease ATP-binding subunit ClpA
MFEKFTEKAIKVIMLAQEESRRLGHNFVGPEQILLGLIGEGTGVAARVLKSMGVNLRDARVEVEKIIGRGDGGEVAVEIPFTPRAVRVLEMTLEEAHTLGNINERNYVSTEHLLLGIVREGGGVAPIVLENLNVDLSRARTLVIQMLDKLANNNEILLDSFFFHQFTKKVIQCLLISSQEAYNLRQREVTLEIIFLGLLKENTSFAAKFLHSMGITLEKVTVVFTNGTNKNKSYAFTPEELKLLENLNLNQKILNNQLDKILLEKDNEVREQNFDRAGELRDQEIELRQSIRRIQSINFKEILEISTQQLFTSDYQLDKILLGKNNAVIKEDWNRAAKLLNQEIERKQNIRSIQQSNLQEMIDISAHLFVKEAWQINFSDDSVNALKSAVNEAKKLNHNHVTPEHILLGLLDTGGVKFVDFLEELGAHALSIRKRLDNILRGEAYTSRDANVYIENFDNYGEFMSEKSINFTARDISGSVVNLGEINGNVTNTINQLNDSQSPNKSELADLLTQLQSAVNSEDSGLDDKDKAKALKHIESIGKLGSKQNDATLREKAEDALDALIGIGGKFASFFGIAKPLIDSVKSILNL